MNNFDYKNMTPFKWFVLENFPFIENDFDAINNYHLFSKVVEYLNKTIDNVNVLGQLVEEFSNYFDNLDVQEEINNKLDEMAEGGQLAEIIAQYLQLAGLLCFNTVNEMKNATNLIDGSFAKTFGKTTYNDGLGEFYKIRTVTNTDVIDNINIIALNNSTTLIAELIPNAHITNLQTQINTINSKELTEMIVIGDSYSSRTYLSSEYELWCERVAKVLNLNLHNYSDPRLWIFSRWGRKTIYI